MANHEENEGREERKTRIGSIAFLRFLLHFVVHCFYKYNRNWWGAIKENPRQEFDRIYRIYRIKTKLLVLNPVVPELVEGFNLVNPV